MKKSGTKTSFKLKLSHDNLLELAEVKKPAVKSGERRVSKSWKGKLMRKLKDKESNRDDLELYKELKLRISTFAAYPFMSLYILAALRFLILLYSLYLVIGLWKEFAKILYLQAGEKVAITFKAHNFVVQFMARLLVASSNTDRCLMLVGVGSFLPLVTVCYGYLVAFCLTLYAATFTNGTADLEKDIWNEHEGTGKHKSFLINRLESCSARLDCVLGYAFTLPVLNFLTLFNFKAFACLSLPAGLFLIFLLLVDEALIRKRKFEIEALFKLFRMYLVIGITGISWIFFIRFVTTEYLKEKLSTGFSDDLGIGIFLCVIIFTVHAAGCATKFILRKMKPSEPKILLVPKRVEPELRIDDDDDDKATEDSENTEVDEVDV